MAIPKFNTKSFLIVLLATLPLLISCKDKDVSLEKAPNKMEEVTLEQKKQALQNVVPAAKMENSSGDLAMNPEHGQPGHRCDLPVGAPLNSTTNQASSSAATTSSAGNNGINPAHGEPGHRCDIKVGDPL